ncbi:unnamed protein product, partial [Prorocentrum cordatum]
AQRGGRRGSAGPRAPSLLGRAAALDSSRAMSTATTAAESRPVIVLVDPTWNFELENFDVERFFEEAKATVTAWASSAAASSASAPRAE